MATPTMIGGYLALFAAVGIAFVFVNLFIGRFLRPRAPNAEKLEVYECGEPTIGSSFVQFDLRFYVVALLFIIFDVEVAFFFPWATVFGKANQLADPNLAVVSQTVAADGAASAVALTPAAAKVFSDLGVPSPAAPLPQGSTAENTAAVRGAARTMAQIGMADILVFFAVLMVGFAYVWRRGDLNWVRATSRDEPAAGPRRVVDLSESEEPALV